MPIVIVTGPQGCGKTKNAKVLAERFNCSITLDGEPLVTLLMRARDLINNKGAGRILVLTHERIKPNVRTGLVVGVHNFNDLEIPQ